MPNAFFYPGSNGKKGKLCTPLVVYLLLSFVGIVAQIVNIDKVDSTLSKKDQEKQRKMNIRQFVMNLSVTMLFAGIIWLLCRNGHYGWAWIVALLWLIILLVLIVVMLIVVGVIVVASESAKRA